jgi:hypothetical protein
MSTTGVPLLNGENGREDLIYAFLIPEYFLSESIQGLKAQTKTLRGTYPEVTDVNQRDQLTQVLAILDRMWTFDSSSTPLMTNLRDIRLFTHANSRFDVETIFRAYQVATGKEKWQTSPLSDQFNTRDGLYDLQTRCYLDARYLRQFVLTVLPEHKYEALIKFLDDLQTHPSFMKSYALQNFQKRAHAHIFHLHNVGEDMRIVLAQPDMLTLAALLDVAHPQLAVVQAASAEATLSDMHRMLCHL